MKSKVLVPKYRSKNTYRIFEYKTLDNKNVCSPELFIFFC
jgi:hypothetical protein